ncbi:unnamed protein product [Closterium sp. NIES-54]
MGPPKLPLSSLPIARLGRALSFCPLRVHGGWSFFFPLRASGARRFSARRAALQSAQRPACPSCAPRRATVPCLLVVRPVARDGALPVVRPEACSGFVACQGAPGARAPPPLPPPTPPPFPIACRGDLGGPRVAPSVARHGALGGPRVGPSRFRRGPPVLPQPYRGPAPPPNLPTRQLPPCPVLGFGGG